MEKLLLWDIDGTLLWVDKAGRHALNAAMEKEFGVVDAMTGISLGGCTDRGICKELFAKYGIRYSAQSEQQLFAAYTGELPAFLAAADGRPLDGVVEILDHLDPCDLHVNALLTGNIEAGARAKLAQYGLWDYFEFGAYGHHSEHRDALGPLALEVAKQVTGKEWNPARTIIIGDTVKDIACARAFGAKVIAVTTGAHSEEQLRKASPDALLPDLSDKELFLHTLDQLG